MHRKPHDVSLDTAPHIGNCPLRGNTKDLGKCEGCDRINQGSSACCQSQQRKEVVPLFADDIINQIFRAGGQNQSCHSTDEHEGETKRQTAAMRRYQPARFTPGLRPLDLLFFRQIHPPLSADSASPPETEILR